MSEKLASTSMAPSGVLKRTNLNIFNMDFKKRVFLSPILDPRLRGIRMKYAMTEVVRLRPLYSLSFTATITYELLLDTPRWADDARQIIFFSLKAGSRRRVYSANTRIFHHSLEHTIWWFHKCSTFEKSSKCCTQRDADPQRRSVFRI